MPVHFTSKILKEKDLKNGQKQVTSLIIKEDVTVSLDDPNNIIKKGAIMSLDDVTNIIKKIETTGREKKKNFKNVLIRVLNGRFWSTYNDVEKFYDYYEGKVAEVDKFVNNIYQIEYTAIFDN